VQIQTIYLKAAVSREGVRQELQFYVDSEMGYSMLKKETWQSLGLQPLREVEFICADGSRIKKPVGECYIELPFEGAHGHTPVILGEEDDHNMLGLLTLEIMGLILDPLTDEIRPARFFL